MFQYAYDAETGEVVTTVPSKPGKLKSKPKSKKASRPKRDILMEARNNIEDKKDINFVIHMFAEIHSEILGIVLEARQHQPPSLSSENNQRLKDLDGVFLSSLTIYRYLLDQNRLNLGQDEKNKALIKLLRSQRWISRLEGLKNWLDNAESYLNRFF